MTMTRRAFAGTASSAAALAATGGAFAQSSEPIRLGLLVVKTGPLASGGIDMERAALQYMKARGNMLAGRKVDLIVADTGGVPATARTKTQELVEKNNVHALVGPLATFEVLAIDDYVREKKIPTMGVAAAEDLTQRMVNPWFVRATSSTAQCAHPMAQYCFKELGYKRMITVADDFAYGQEMTGGFQRAFEDAGGKIVQKLFPPLTAPDYGTYVSQMKQDADAVFLGFAGSNGFRFVRQMNEYGLLDKIKPIGGMTALDESVLRNMGDEALGIVTTCWYSGELGGLNTAFAGEFRKDWKYDPGFYAAGTYASFEVLDAALKATGGKVEDKEGLMKALRASDVDTVRGHVKMDAYGNAIGDVYIRKVARKDGRLVNAIVKTYPNVSQFGDYDPKAFLANPVYSRDFPPSRFIEK